VHGTEGLLPFSPPSLPTYAHAQKGARARSDMCVCVVINLNRMFCNFETNNLTEPCNHLRIASHVVQLNLLHTTSHHRAHGLAHAHIVTNGQDWPRLARGRARLSNTFSELSRTLFAYV
jgi:hypothetical protein